MSKREWELEFDGYVLFVDRVWGEVFVTEDILPNQDWGDDTCDKNIYFLEGRGISVANGDVII